MNDLDRNMKELVKRILDGQLDGYVEYIATAATKRAAFLDLRPKPVVFEAGHVYQVHQPGVNRHGILVRTIAKVSHTASGGLWTCKIVGIGASKYSPTRVGEIVKVLEGRMREPV